MSQVYEDRELGRMAGNTMSLPTIGCIMGAVFASMGDWEEPDAHRPAFYNQAPDDFEWIGPKTVT